MSVICRMINCFLMVLEFTDILLCFTMIHCWMHGSVVIVLLLHIRIGKHKTVCSPRMCPLEFIWTKLKNLNKSPYSSEATFLYMVGQRLTDTIQCCIYANYERTECSLPAWCWYISWLQDRRAVRNFETTTRVFKFRAIKTVDNHADSLPLADT